MDMKRLLWNILKRNTDGKVNWTTHRYRSKNPSTKLWGRGNVTPLARAHRGTLMMQMKASVETEFTCAGGVLV